MTFTESIQACFSNYANFNGRATRSEYWWFALFIFVTSIVLSMVNEMLGSLFALGTLIPSIAAATRRLHDTDRSGWIQLILLVPLIGFLVMVYFLAQEGQAGSNKFGEAATDTASITMG